MNITIEIIERAAAVKLDSLIRNYSATGEFMGFKADAEQEAMRARLSQTSFFDVRMTNNANNTFTRIESPLTDTAPPDVLFRELFAEIQRKVLLTLHPTLLRTSPQNPAPAPPSRAMTRQQILPQSAQKR